MKLRTHGRVRPHAVAYVLTCVAIGFAIGGLLQGCDESSAGVTARVRSLHKEQAVTCAQACESAGLRVKRFETGSFADSFDCECGQ